jgi:hypothetical protein
MLQAIAEWKQRTRAKMLASDIAKWADVLVSRSISNKSCPPALPPLLLRAPHDAAVAVEQLRAEFHLSADEIAEAMRRAGIDVDAIDAVAKALADGTLRPPVHEDDDEHAG